MVGCTGQPIVSDGLIFSSVAMRESMMVLHSAAVVIAPGGTGTEWETYQIIESTVRPILTSRHWLLDHSTGPEILTFAGRTLVELTLCETTVTTMARIVGARVQGARLGDPCEAALTALVRGFDEHGEYFERTVWRGAPKEEASPADIVAGLAAQGIGVLATPHHPSRTIGAPASVNR